MTKTIGEKILSSIEVRSKTLLNNKFLISCLFLDPRFTHTLTPQQENDAVNHLKSIWDRTNDINSTGQLCSTPNSGSHQSVNSFFMKKMSC